MITSKMRYFDKRKYGFLIAWVLLTVILGWLAISMFNEIYYLRLPWARKEIKSPVSKDKSILPIEKEAHAEAPVQVSGQSSASTGQELKTLVLSYFPKKERECVDELIMRESTWNPHAVNPTSEATGLFQALPWSKTGCSSTSDTKCQASWGSAYVLDRYGDGCTALAFQKQHGYY